MAHGTQEVEIKVAIPDVASARRLLRAAGFRVSQPRVFESNTVFDAPGLPLRTSGSLLRVREVKGTATLTYKGPATTKKHKSREELEVTAGDARVLQSILERLGFESTFRYEKYRTELRGEGRGVIMLDETPVGVYLELEGSPRWIDRTARRLGFAEKDYITDSYWRLYADWCKRQGREPRHMLLAGRRKR